MSIKKIISVAAVASIGAVTWQRLSDDQKTSVKNAVRDGRRKLANFIAPREYLGDLTDSVDPAFMEELTELMMNSEDAIDVDVESTPGGESSDSE